MLVVIRESAVKGIELVEYANVYTSSPNTKFISVHIFKKIEILV